MNHASLRLFSRFLHPASRTHSSHFHYIHIPFTMEFVTCKSKLSRYVCVIHMFSSLCRNRNRRFYLKIVKAFVPPVLLLLNLSHIFNCICFTGLLIKVLKESTVSKNLIIPHNPPTLHFPSITSRIQTLNMGITWNKHPSIYGWIMEQGEVSEINLKGHDLHIFLH